jgi:hypothetical protein
MYGCPYYYPPYPYYTPYPYGTYGYPYSSDPPPQYYQYSDPPSSPSSQNVDPAPSSDRYLNDGQWHKFADAGN